jgi:(p)ppGpp synthase/HD superfamily hydrolase
MIYTELTKKAMKLMYEAHAGQVDKSGIPYVFHPWHVAESMEDEITCCAALLHDVAEDTAITLEDIVAAGMPEEVIHILRLLTHDSDEDYYDYIRRIGTDACASRVKLADLRHNSDLTRLDYVTEKDRQRHKKYLWCIEYLEHAMPAGH